MQTSIRPDAPLSAPPLPAIGGASEKLASGPRTTYAEPNVWQTQTFTEESRQGNDYMHARYYNPGIGRFLSVDPVGGTVGSSQSWNRYSYVLNNPLVYVDPSGETLMVAGEDELALLKDALVEAGAQKIADSLTVTETDDGLVVSGVGRAFTRSTNKTVALVASLINDTKNTTTFSLTPDAVGIGGGETRPTGENTAAVTINAEQVAGLMVHGERDGRSLLGPMTATIALVHELGHAEAHFRGYPIGTFAFYAANAEKAIMYENAHRRKLTGPVHFTRTAHTGKQLDPNYWSILDPARWVR